MAGHASTQEGITDVRDQADYKVMELPSCVPYNHVTCFDYSLAEVEQRWRKGQRDEPCHASLETRFTIAFAALGIDSILIPCADPSRLPKFSFRYPGHFCIHAR